MAGALIIWCGCSVNFHGVRTMWCGCSVTFLWQAQDLVTLGWFWLAFSVAGAVCGAVTMSLVMFLCNIW